MTKEELIEVISQKIGFSKKQAGETLNVILDEIIKTLSQGKEIQFPGFGKFLVIQRKERMGINPKTKEKIKILAMKVPKFRAGKILKEAVK
ncbi:MAG: HU family DNA-binding protein [Candidatus Parcubacteria bacterium]|nr:HU family DNA-binding protein [Candidatus Parcubacteria bacterium]